MTSLFDQYEQVSVKTRSKFNSPQLSNLGYLNMTLDQDGPIFTRSKKDFTPPEKITHIAISNKYMILAMGNGILLRMNLNNPQDQNEIILSKFTTGKLTNLFLDPTGSHLLLAFSNKIKTIEGSELHYLLRKSEKLKTSPKFKGHDFTEVAWCPMNESQNGTGTILIGTSKGLIFETEIMLEGEKFFSSGLEQYWRQVFDIGKGKITPITGLEYFDRGTNRYAIFAATPSKLYYFYGSVDSDEKPLLQQVFNRYLNVPDSEICLECETIPNSTFRHSRLQFWSENLISPNSLAWITEKGIRYGQIDLLTDQTIDSIEQKTELIPYPKPMYEDYSVSLKYPTSLALTQFHVLLAYPDSIKGMCLLNQEIVYEDNYNEAFGKLINVLKDFRTGEIWAVTENAMFKFKIHQEERNIWQIFCANNEFELAKKYSQNNEICYNQVLIKEADKLFSEKKYELSAQRYAETQCGFEEICLKFMQVEQHDSLKIFLRKKFETLKSQDKTQITMIVIWVVELYLTKLERKRLEGLEKSAGYDEIQKEFEAFLALQEDSDCIKNNRSTFYDLMSTHGDKTNLIKLTIVNKDFEQLIRHHLFKNSFHEALEVLKSQNNLELYYQFAPIFMQEVPKYMVKTLIEQGRKLSPLRLIPALVACESETEFLEVIKYLEFCIHKLKTTDKSIHNFLVSLYAKYEPAKLMEYLNAQGLESSLVNYDVHFALRICQEQNLRQACVQLFALLNLWESAVDLALEENLDLAKKVANMSPENDLELRKKLWLKIAQNVVSGKDDIQQAIQFLKECELIKIEDILPFFPDFVTIDHFKEAICNSLKEYNDYIKVLKKEMEDGTEAAEQVREEIHQFRNSYSLIKNTDTCEICGYSLMVRPFYLFPCHHKFHTDCMLSELLPNLNDAKRSRLSELEQQLKVLNRQMNADTISTGSTGMSAKDQVKAEIDNIIASECLYCGENMIRNIDKPFIEDYDYEDVMREWK